MIGGWAWPGRFGGVSPLWRPDGHAARRVLRWAAAASLVIVGLVLCLIEPSTLELWRVLLWTFVVLVLPSWLLVVFLSGLLSVGAWTVRSNVVTAGTSAVAPALVGLGLGMDPLGVAVMAVGGPAAVWITWMLRWRSGGVAGRGWRAMRREPRPTGGVGRGWRAMRREPRPSDEGCGGGR